MRQVPSHAQEPMRLFSQKYAVQSVARSNQDIAQEFMELSFELERGTKIERFTRFKGPIVAAFIQTPSVSASHDLDQLIARLRREALIDIRRGPDQTHANINIEFVPQEAMNERAPTAACFVEPNAKTWQNYMNTKYAANHRWTQLTVRTQATVFIPMGSPPQEIRDCLHEEILQALGPLNDLYRVSETIFNDDNFQVIATPYDMLILRAYYSDQLRNGMSKAAVGARILGILNAQNPAGIGILPRAMPKTDVMWKRAVVSALGVGSSSSERLRGSKQMVNLALTQGYNDVRLGFSYYGRARVLERIKPKQSKQNFIRAYNTFNKTLTDSTIHRANVAMKLARMSISENDPQKALEWIESALPAARNTQNAIMLFTLLALKAEAYRLTGQENEARTLQNEARGWGNYAYATPQSVQARLTRIARLGVRK
jgi:hypothetical protein